MPGVAPMTRAPIILERDRAWNPASDSARCADASSFLRNWFSMRRRVDFGP